ncbi:MAG: VOC family protein [Phycisphaerales bacterium]|nr:VOC family protein [Hyphomonadaceae bacterium]
MIAGFDHVVIAVRDLAAGVAAYETLLGRAARPSVQSDGVARAVIATSNLAVELMAPVGEGEGGRRLRAALDDGGEGLKSLVFAVASIDQAHRRLERVGLAPQPIETRESWRSCRADTTRTFGVRLFFIERAAPLAYAPAGDANVSGLDHIVIRTADPERAAALYGARLGLDMRLDRELMGRRLMFFRCGDAIVEVVLDETLSADRLWGLSWRVADADATRARLAAAGLNVSEVRAGMKPGTRVFTVRDGTCGAPTLMVEQGRA